MELVPGPGEQEAKALWPFDRPSEEVGEDETRLGKGAEMEMRE